jgi:hypothetical protein
VRLGVVFSPEVEPFAPILISFDVSDEDKDAVNLSAKGSRYNAMSLFLNEIDRKEAWLKNISAGPMV